ncbi:MAG: hypothetical protein ABI472_16985, partial [Ginsengibacter sp.]
MQPAGLHNKPHCLVLDGLSCVAAIMVVAFHPAPGLIAVPEISSVSNLSGERIGCKSIVTVRRYYLYRLYRKYTPQKVWPNTLRQGESRKGYRIVFSKTITEGPVVNHF